MIGFLIKKGFFDIWDNLVSIVVMNLGYLAVLGLVVLSSYVGETSVAGGYAILAMAILYLSLYSLGISGVTFGLSRMHSRTISPMHCFISCCAWP